MLFQPDPHSKEGKSGMPMPIAPVDHMEYLIGRVLTILDVASSSEPTKSLIRQELWNWYDGLPSYETLNGADLLPVQADWSVNNSDGTSKVVIPSTNQLAKAKK